MDTDENVSSLMKSIDMDSIEKHLREVTPFTLLIKFVDAQQALEECGLIYDPKNGMYQSLEEGTRWKAEANPEGGVVVSPAPVTYENITSGEMGVSIGVQIPVFYPEQKAFTSQYLLGAGRCYFELEDYARAKDSLNSLLKDFAATNEATLAKAELDKIARRQKALEGVK